MATAKKNTKSVKEVPEKVLKNVKETPENSVKTVEKPTFKAGKYQMITTYCGQFTLGKIYKEGAVYDLTEKELAVLSLYVKEVK